MYQVPESFGEWIALQEARPPAPEAPKASSHVTAWTVIDFFTGNLAMHLTVWIVGVGLAALPFGDEIVTLAFLPVLTLLPVAAILIGCLFVRRVFRLFL